MEPKTSQDFKFTKAFDAAQHIIRHQLAPAPAPTAASTKPNNLPKVLLLKPPTVFRVLEHEFSKHFNFIKPYESPLPLPQFLAANATDITAMLASALGPKITAKDVLDYLPGLRCIVNSSTGIDHIDVHECRRRGIIIANAADVISIDCCETAINLLYGVLRKVVAGDRFVRGGGNWSSTQEYSLGFRLKGKRIGIIGFGSIGSKVAKRLEAFGCIISYNSRQKRPSIPYQFYSNVIDLAATSDALVICCALTDETRHLIDKEVLSALGKQGVIVNVARGAIVDEEELVRFLVEGKIAGAGLDVFEHEPKVPKELLGMDNVVLSPHQAVFTEEGFMDLFELLIGNLNAFFSNQPLISPITD